MRRRWRILSMMKVSGAAVILMSRVKMSRLGIVLARNSRIDDGRDGP